MLQLQSTHQINAKTFIAPLKTLLFPDQNCKLQFGKQIAKNDKKDVGN